MKPEAAGSNGIGPLVRQFVHERNAARKAGDSAPTTTTSPAGDTVQLSAAALARFEAWKAKHAAPAPVEEPVVETEPVVDQIPPVTEPPTTPIDEPAPLSIVV